MLMHPFPIAFGFLGLALLLSAARRKKALPTHGLYHPPDEDQMRSIIIDLIFQEAKRQSVAPWVALTFAELESGLNPLAFGDRDWALRNPNKWATLQKRMPDNPGLSDPKLWGAYGLFQLLAPYHVRSSEHPTLLFDPRINARRGIAVIKRALKKTGGDVLLARRLYVCGPKLRCSSQKLTRIDQRLSNIYPRWTAYV